MQETTSGQEPSTAEPETVESPGTEKKSTPESSGAVNSSGTSESSEVPRDGDSEVSESPETATTEYGSTPETESETETETKSETETPPMGEDMHGTGSTDAALPGAFGFLNGQLAEDALLQQQYYEDMLGYADSINHVCTITVGLILAILLCTGITCGCMVAHSVWSSSKGGGKMENIVSALVMGLCLFGSHYLFAKVFYKKKDITDLEESGVRELTDVYNETTVLLISESLQRYIELGIASLLFGFVLYSLLSLLAYSIHKAISLVNVKPY